MARFTRLEVYNTIIDAGLVPVFYHADIEVAKKVVDACRDGGATVVEFTNRGDFAPEVFKQLSQHLSQTAPEVILGVGSVIDEPTAALYIAYGANFVVGPLLPSFVTGEKLPICQAAAAFPRYPMLKSLGWKSSRSSLVTQWEGRILSRQCWGLAPGRALCRPVELIRLKRALKHGSGQA